jgi:hypothetical protein
MMRIQCVFDWTWTTLPFSESKIRTVELLANGSAFGAEIEPFQEGEWESHCSAMGNQKQFFRKPVRFIGDMPAPFN